MFDQKLNAMLSVLNEEEKYLVQQSRKDEAVFVRIRMNTVNIGKTVWQVVLRTEKAEAQKSVYLTKMEALRQAWQESGSRAEKYQDHDKAMIEEIKLNTLKQVIALFEECVP